MKDAPYTMVSQINPLTEARMGGSQYNAYSMVQVAEAMQCQKQYRHFVVVLLLAFCFMLSLEQFKKSLGKRAETLTDVQIEKLRASMYLVADTLFDTWKKPLVNVTVGTKVTIHNQNGNAVWISIFVPAYV